MKAPQNMHKTCKFRGGNKAVLPSLARCSRSRHKSTLRHALRCRIICSGIACIGNLHAIVLRWVCSPHAPFYHALPCACALIACLIGEASAISSVLSIATVHETLNQMFSPTARADLAYRNGAKPSNTSLPGSTKGALCAIHGELRRQQTDTTNLISDFYSFRVSESRARVTCIHQSGRAGQTARLWRDRSASLGPCDWLSTKRTCFPTSKSGFSISRPLCWSSAGILQGMVVPFAGGERCMRLGMARSSLCRSDICPAHW